MRGKVFKDRVAIRSIADHEPLIGETVDDDVIDYTAGGIADQGVTT